MRGREVAIVGIGASKFDSITAGYSFKELMYDASKKAYGDADVDPRNDIGSFICCCEDFWDGNSITDEYMPDQLGAKLRSLFTVTGDGLLGLAHGCMHIMAGVTELVAVESHSKLSDVVSKQQIEDLGFDPVYGRLPGIEPDYLAGLEMRRYLEESGNIHEDCASVVVKNKENATKNDRAVYGGKVSKTDVLTSGDIATPLTRLEKSQYSDGSVVIVLASAKKAKKFTDKPIWIRGIAWFSDTPNIEEMELGAPSYALNSSMNAYKMAGIKDPTKQIDFAEVDDTYSFKELAHIEAIGLAKKAGKFVSSGKANRDGVLPVNPSGGSLGMGNFVEATGLVKVYESVMQLRGHAGAIQLTNPKKCVVQSWRGLPTQSGVTAVLSK